MLRIIRNYLDQYHYYSRSFGRRRLYLKNLNYIAAGGIYLNKLSVFAPLR